MNKISSYLNTPLSWEFKKKKAFFKSDGKTILELKTGKKKAFFKSDIHSYTIRNKGFWNPCTIVEEDKKCIAQVKRFFQSKSTWIEFTDGNKYLLRCKNLTFIKLSVYSADLKEIVRYKLISKYKASVNLYSSEIPETDQKILLVLGCFIFRGIIKENKSLNIESIVFSNAVPVKEIALTDTV